jgi:ATP-dependent protease HslVU (ClpYQ) peptidase subunit
MSENGSNGEGAEKPREVVLTLTYNLDTCQVAIGGDPIHVALGQMMLDEAQRQLEQVRRLAAAQGLAAAAAETRRVQDLVSRARGGRA